MSWWQLFLGFLTSCLPLWCWRLWDNNDPPIAFVHIAKHQIKFTWVMSWLELVSDFLTIALWCSLWARISYFSNWLLRGGGKMIVPRSYRCLETRKVKLLFGNKKRYCQEWDSNPCPFGPVPETGALDQLGHLDVWAMCLISNNKKMRNVCFGDQHTLQYSQSRVVNK